MGTYLVGSTATDGGSLSTGVVSCALLLNGSDSDCMDNLASKRHNVNETKVKLARNKYVDDIY